jgi:hypothetical protein
MDGPMQNPNQTPLLKLIGAHDDDPAALGRGVLRLAHYAAAMERFAQAEAEANQVEIDPEWEGLNLTDSAGHGWPATSPLARLGGSEATEGDR